MTSTAEPVPSTPDDEQWLTPGVKGIGTASLLADVGHEIPTALLPSLLTSTLGAPAAALGLIEGIADGLAGVARFAGGALADDPERRRATAVGGYASTAVLSALVGVATSVWQVGVLRAGAWAARGLRVPARNALLADVVPAGSYGRAYGFERAMDNLGAVGGPLLALGLVALVGVRAAILLSVIPGLLAVAAILYAIRRTARPRTQARQPLRVQVRPVLHGRLGRLMVGIGAFELGNVAATLLILRATDLLTPGHGARRRRPARARAVRRATTSPRPSQRSRRAHGRPPRRACSSWPPASLLLPARVRRLRRAPAPASPCSPLCFVAAGVAIGCVETAEHAAVAALAPDEIRGSAFGLLAAVQSFGNFVASAVAGAAVDVACRL